MLWFSFLFSIMTWAVPVEMEFSQFQNQTKKELKKQTSKSVSGNPDSKVCSAQKLSKTNNKSLESCSVEVTSNKEIDEAQGEQSQTVTE